MSLILYLPFQKTVCVGDITVKDYNACPRYLYTLESCYMEIIDTIVHHRVKRILENYSKFNFSDNQVVEIFNSLLDI